MRINGQIRVPEVRLIGDNGDQYGVVRIEDAKRMAEERGLDLVEVSPNSRPPVAKLIDYGKYKYQLQKKSSDAKKKQNVVQLKEIQFRPNIEKHDLEIKVKKAIKFLGNGDRVKLIMQFRGREVVYKDAGLEKFRVILEQLVESGGVIDADAKMVGMRSIAMVSPGKSTQKK